MKIETLAALAARSDSLGEGEDGGGRMTRAPGTSYNELVRLEIALAAMESGAEAAVFSSGLAATTAVLQTLSPGDHVIASEQVHGGTRRLMTELMGHWGLEISFVDTTHPDEVKVALRDKTRLVWVETPTSATLQVTEISRIAATAHRAGALCVVDNTSTTPVLQQPLLYRADVVMHLTTSYLSGHGESRGGAVIVAENGPFFEQLRKVQALAGAHLSSFDSWLICRGLSSLPQRMRAVCETAEQIVTFLWGHPGVEAVYYPGLPEHPGHHVARAQMDGFGGRLSFTVAGGAEVAMVVSSATRLITNDAPAGSPQSRIEHLASIEVPGETPPENMLRLSVGLENPADLIKDIDGILPRP